MAKRGLSGTQHGIRVSSRGWPKSRKTRKRLPIYALNRSRSGSSSHCDVDPESYRTPMVMIFGYVVEDIKVHLLQNLVQFGWVDLRERRSKSEPGWLVAICWQERNMWGLEEDVGSCGDGENIKGKRYFRSLLSICFVIGNSWINLGRRI